MNTKHIYIYSPFDKGVYGISVIVDHLKESFERNGIPASIIKKLDGVDPNACVIPYALDGAYEMIKKGFRLDYVFMADAFTLGYKNKVLFYLKNRNIFHYDFFYSTYCYIRDIHIENTIIAKFKNVILVSETDIRYLSGKRCSKANYICLPNGAEFRDIEPRHPSITFRLGILSSWGHKVTAKENDVVIRKYIVKYMNKHPNVELILAGRGKYINQYQGIRNVKVIGEIPDLNTFFSNIDVFISANAKGCGILNRVMDAFAYKTPVLGHSNSFSGYRYMNNAFLEFEDYDSFEINLDKLINDQFLRESLALNAYCQIRQNNNWNKLYNGFIKKHFGNKIKK